MRLIAVIVLSASAIVLSGCETISTKARVNPNTVADYHQSSCPTVRGGGLSRLGVIDLDCFRFPSDKAPDPTDPDAAFDPTAYKAASADAAARGRLESVLLTQADNICTLEKGRMTSVEAATNSGFSIATTALSAASTIVGGDLAKSILSGAAAVTSGSQDHINTHVYRNQITQAITKVIDGERAKVLTELISKRKTAIGDYPVDEMIRLVNRYHQTCSFSHGLQVLLDAGVNAAGRDAIIEERNLRATATFLQTQIGTADPSTKTALEEKRKEVLLKIAAVRETSDTAAPAD
ncbi:hypothetical protein WG908_12820 [Sphingobium sp. AN641]|uniref:hypothetical protein n=1 Tax=Sphingobium sp. AN641 TaxID=3133443 RepID=UPI0030BF2D53